MLSSVTNIYQTQSIRLGTQFTQHYDHGDFFPFFWPSRILITVANSITVTYFKSIRSLFLIDIWIKNCQILMIFSYFLWESYSWLGSKCLHKLVLYLFMPHKINIYLGFSLFKTTHLLIRRINDFLSELLYENDPKERKKYFCNDSQFSGLFCVLGSFIPCDTMWYHVIKVCSNIFNRPGVAGAVL